MRPRRVPSLFLAMLLVAPWGLACDPEPERVKVTVVAILATSNDDKVHPKLTCLAAAIQKMHPNLTGFRLGRNTSKPIPVGTPTKFALADGQEASIEVTRCTVNPERFCLQIKSPTLVGQITYSAVCGKYMPIDSGHVTRKEGDRLFLAIMVEPCPKKTPK